MPGFLMVGAVAVIVIIAFYMMASLLFLKASSAAHYHIVLCMALFCYSLGYLMELQAQDLPTVIAALRIENLGIAAIGPFFMLSMMQLCDFKQLKNWMGMAGLMYVFVMAAIVFTNDYHSLYYTSYSLQFGDWTQLVMGRGPVFFINQAVGMATAFVGFVLLVRRYMEWTKTMRRRMIYIILGSLGAFVGNLLNVIGIFGGTVDVMPFTFGITLVFFYIGVSRNGLYQISKLGAEQAAQTMDDAMVVLDADGGLIYYNNSAGELFPTITQLTNSAEVATLIEWPKSLRGKLAEGEVTFCSDTAHGERYFRCNITKVGNTGGWSIVMRDVTETVQLTSKLEELADTDALTGIFNRRHFIEMLEYELLRMERYDDKASLIMFDLDYFKKVNDTYGHSVGDQVLIAVAKSVQGVLRASDVFGRYGGEEFLILCPVTKATEARYLAERIREVIGQTVVYANGVEVRVNASVGVAQIDCGAKIDEVINRADTAMYTSKSGGRNRVSLFDIPTPPASNA